MLAERVKEWNREWEKRSLDKGKAEGKAEGKGDLLLMQLELKFGLLPPKYRSRLKNADVETLLTWGERILFANSISEVFDS